MSRSTLYIVGALVIGIAALLLWGKRSSTVVVLPPAVSTPPVISDVGDVPAPPVPVPLPPVRSNPTNQNISINAITPVPADPEAAAKIAGFEKQYLDAKTQDARMDVVNALGEVISGETVQSLARLFTLEKDKDLQVDLVDALQGITGFKEEKLVFLATGIKPGLDRDVRQAAIDGLIDLEDRRSIAVLQSLLNDPDEVIVQAAKDAIKILESPLTPPLPNP